MKTAKTDKKSLSPTTKKSARALLSIIGLLLIFFTIRCDNSGVPGGGGSGNKTGGNTTPDTPQSTPFRITNSCQSTIWIQQQNMPSGTPSVVQLNSGTSFDFNIPAAGLASTRFWPKTGCDSTGQNCAIGQSSNPCPSVGCAPPVDSKMEATWGCTLSNTSQCTVDPQGNVLPAVTSFNASAVDGFTLPFKVNVSPTDNNTCNNFDCSNLSLNSCPTNENLSKDINNNVAFSTTSVDLKVINPSNGAFVGCFSPCKVLDYPGYGGMGLQDETGAQEAPYCCPTPPISSAECRAGPVPNTQYVNLIHTTCTGGVYGYAYDDGVGLHNCSAATQIEMVFGPNCP